MRSVPEEIEVSDLAAALTQQWGLSPELLDYAPVGGGAYHWVLTAGAERRFITVDDLDTKPWLGDDRDSRYAGLRGAYQTARDLRSPFVVAPEASTVGECAFRISDQYSVAVFPYVDGDAGHWGDPVDADGRDQLVALLARLHDSPGDARTTRRHDVEVPGRARFERDLAELGETWVGGPLAEPLRHELAEYRDRIASWLSTFDELAAQVVRSGFAPVVTHGEPHPGNLIRTADGFLLVDWDTVALGRPERDLWMLEDGTGVASSGYRELTGRSVDPGAITLYRLAWKLADLAAFTRQLRSPHRRDPDNERALSGIHSLLTGNEPLPYGEPVRTG